MNKLKSWIIVIMLAVAGLVVLQLPASSSEVIAPFGEWNVDVTMTDMNNNSIPLSIETWQGQILSVFHGGTQISSITYTLSASATGEGYSTCELNLAGAYIVADVDGTYYAGGDGGFTTLNIGDDPVVVFTLTMGVAALDNLAAGDYTLIFHLVQGSYSYRGMPGGDWQQSTSLPSASFGITVADEHYCYQCDGEGGINSYQTSDPGCPSGWFETITVSECECYTDTSYGSWSSWSDMGCSDDCYMQQQRTRTIYEGEYCPGMSGEPDWVAVGTDTDYQTVYDSDCCNPTYVTCYQCDGNGGVDSQQFEGSCGSGWYSSPPSCSCYTESSYGSWGSWQFMYCMGFIVYERRARDKLERECCPGGGCDAWSVVGTNWDYRSYVDITQCPGGGQIVTCSSMFTVSTPEFTPYYVDAEHYLGVIRN